MAIATAAWTHGMRSHRRSSPRERMHELYAGAKMSASASTQMLDDVNVVHIQDLGIQIHEQAVLEPRIGDSTKRYLWHLITKAVIAIGAIISSLLVAWIAALNLALFIEHRTSLFHPLISVFVLAACLALIIVAMVAIFTVQRYFRETMGSL